MWRISLRRISGAGFSSKRFFCQSSENIDPVIQRRSRFRVKSILKQVSRYDSDTKLSTKIYHFQELFETGENAKELLDSETFAQLRNQVFSRESLCQLSPTQIVSLFRSLGVSGGKDTGEWSLLCDALKHSCSKMSAAEVAMCLHSIAKVKRTFVVRDRVLETVMKHLLSVSNSWSGMDMGKFLYFMRNCEDRDKIPVWNKMLNQIAYRFNERLDEQMNSKNIAFILHEFSLLGLLPAKAIHRACQRVLRQGLESLDSSTWVIFLAALVRLEIRKPDLFFPLVKYLRSHGLPRITDMNHRKRIVRSYKLLNLLHSKTFPVDLLDGFN